MIDRVDKTIILYGPNELEFDNQGYGVLSDASNAIATEELNGKYEVTFEYPMNGIHFNELVLGRIILVNPTPFAGKQPFRIYQISKPLKGIVKVSAQHLSYDLSDCPVDPVEEFTVTEPS